MKKKTMIIATTTLLLLGIVAVSAPIIYFFMNTNHDNTISSNNVNNENGSSESNDSNGSNGSNDGSTNSGVNQVIKSIIISTNKYNYNVNDRIAIISKLNVENINIDDVKYRWYIKHDGSSNYSKMDNQTGSKLVINAKTAYNNTSFKLIATYNEVSVSSNEISIIVDDITDSTQPSESSNYYISTQNNVVNIGQGISFILYLKDNREVLNQNFTWKIKKPNEQWKTLKSDISGMLTINISDNTYNKSIVKATTFKNGKEISTNEIMIHVDEKNYVANDIISYSSSVDLIPLNIASRTIETIKLPFNVKETLIKSIMINGVEQKFEKLIQHEDTFT